VLAGRAHFSLADLRAPGLALPPHTARFDVVVDKGTLDAFVHGGTNDGVFHAAVQHLGDLLEPGGALLQITPDPPEMRVEMLESAMRCCGKNTAWGGAGRTSFASVGPEGDEDALFLYTTRRMDRRTHGST
jgi:hypothetical protein